MTNSLHHQFRLLRFGVTDKMQDACKIAGFRRFALQTSFSFVSASLLTAFNMAPRQANKVK